MAEENDGQDTGAEASGAYVILWIGRTHFVKSRDTEILSLAAQPA
jgi:hypothetical protein